MDSYGSKQALLRASEMTVYRLGDAHASLVRAARQIAFALGDAREACRAIVDAADLVDDIGEGAIRARTEAQQAAQAFHGAIAPALQTVERVAEIAAGAIVLAEVLAATARRRTPANDDT
jgi:hypothetical protein